MEHSEFLHWLAFTRHEPIGNARTDMQTALLMATLINLWNDKRTKVEDLLPDWWGDQAPSIDDKFMALMMAMGGKRGTDPRDIGD